MAALDKKALDPVLLDLRGKSDYADYLLVLGAESERQVDAIARAIEERLAAAGLRRRSVEAAGESNWLLMDFGDLVVHAFFRGARSFYDLEGLWADAPRVPLPATAQAVS
jgi:ribosome-associated protein